MVARDARAADAAADAASARTYQVRTYGCQMNVHDSERLAGLLEAAGYQRAAEGRSATPTWWCSTPAPSGRTPTTSCTATSATWRRASAATPRCRSRSVAAWPRRTGTRCCARRPGSTSSSAPTTSGRCPRCWSGPGTTRSPRWKSPRRCRSSRPRCPVHANPLMPLGFPSRSGATTAARSASFRRCGAKRSTAVRTTSWPRCRSLVDDGVLEVTLLGQNVNAYGVSFADPALPRDRGAFAESAARLRRHRRAGTGAVHLAASGRIHRRRHRGHGADAECLPGPAHAAAIRVRPGAARDATVLPRRALSGHHRPRPGGHAARRHHHRSDRRIPRGDRRGFRRHAGRGASGPVLGGVHLPVLQAARHPGRRTRRAATESRCAGTVRAAGRAAGADLAAGQSAP